jgi:predicted acyltransferase
MAEASPRFLSLDVFRGMTICFMIIVNNPGGESFWPLNHAHWNGFTPTDLVFPSFLFAVGNAMSFTMKKFAQMSDAQVLAKIFKRTILIFLIGYLMYWFPFVDVHNGHWDFRPISHTRILGVLQRIALCYCFASLMIHYLSERAVIIVSILLLIGYWVILLVFGDPSNPLGMLTNAGTYIDKALFGDNHLYHGEGVAFDPEGLLSTMTSIVNVVIGYYAGKFVQQKGKTYETVSKLVIFGALFIFIAICWDSFFPINKKLWSSSFVMITTGIDLVLIGILIYVVEILKWNKGNWTNFFTVVGKNPLFVYITSEVLLTILAWIVVGGKGLPDWAGSFWQYVAPGKWGSLFFAISFMLVCWFVGYVLDKRKIYIRV